MVEDWRKYPHITIRNGVTREHSTYKGEMIKQADANLLAYPLGLITDEYRQRQDLEYYAERIDQKMDRLCRTLFIAYSMLVWEKQIKHTRCFVVVMSPI